MIVAAITSNIRQPALPGDIALSDWKAAGLLLPSVVTAILQTVRREHIERVLGSLNAADRTAVEREFAAALGLLPAGSSP